MRIGWIGLGNMGSAMARRVLDAGHELVVWNRTPTKAQALVEHGARLAKAPAEAAEQELLVTMLADDAALRSVLDAGGALESLRGGSVHVSMSTISPALARELDAAHRARGVSLVGAPVFGRPDAAAQGKLFVLAAGDRAAVARCRPLFERLSQKVLDLGEQPASAHLTKVLGNFLLISSVELLAEVLKVAHKSGLEPDACLAALTGSVFSAPFFAGYGGAIATQNFAQPAAFTLPLALKDVRLALAAAQSNAEPLPLGAAVSARLEQAIADGGAELDLSALGKWS